MPRKSLINNKRLEFGKVDLSTKKADKWLLKVLDAIL